MVNGCRWTSCGDSCKTTEKELATSHSLCSSDKRSKSYCCPQDTALYDCKWRGTPTDCADAKCMPDEVAIANEQQGDSFWGCAWGRKRSNCCKVAIPPSERLMCRYTTCDLDPEACLLAEQGISESDVDDDSLVLEKRGDKRSFSLPGTSISWDSQPYPSPGDLMNMVRNSLVAGLVTQYFAWRYSACGDAELDAIPLDLTQGPPLRGQVEHPMPVSGKSRIVNRSGGRN